VLKESEPIAASEEAGLDANHATVARRGREPGLQLNRNGRAVELRQWALELIDSMRGVCEMLDEGDSQRPYSAALELQESKVNDPALTPSARSLEELRSTGESFGQMALRMSNVHRNYFLDLYPPNEQRLSDFTAQAVQSLEQQAAIERSDAMTFDQYLANYFAR
jgi:glutamate--cysteine ligase